MKVQKHKNLAQFRKHQKQEEKQNSPKPRNRKRNPISLETQETRNHKKIQEPKISERLELR